jgi:hypothetical protein
VLGSFRILFLVAAVVSAGVLAGCTGGPDGSTGEPMDEPVVDPDPYIEGIGPDFVVLMNPIDGADCRLVDVLVEVTEEEAARLVPEPFRLAPGPVTGSNAGLLIEVMSCASGVSEDGDGPYARAWVGVLVEPPVLPEPASAFGQDNRTRAQDADQSLDLYVVSAYTSGLGFQRFLRQSGVPFDLGVIDVGLESVAGLLLAQVSVEERGSDQEALRVAAALRSNEELTMHRTAWAVTRHGVQAFEEELTAGGAAFPVFEGTGACVAPEGGRFAADLGLQGCAPAMVRAMERFDTTGHSLWFHHTSILE